MKFDYGKITNPIWHFETHELRDPAVYLHNGLAYIYFTWYDHKAVTWHVGMSVTADFLTFSEVRLISPSGYASPGNILKVDKRFVICLQQYQNFPHTIAIAWSDDLINWSAPEIVFNTGTDNQWNLDGRVIDPYIVEDNGNYYCFYTGSNRWGKKSGHNFIGVARSQDLRNWEDLSLDKPVIGVDYSWEEPDGNENNCVIRRADGTWFMLYSASLQNQKIAWAVSDDLINWKKGGLCQLPAFKEAQQWQSAPFIIENLGAPNTWHLLFHGANFEIDHQKTYFFLLESNDLVNWH